MDKELEAILEIEKKLEGLLWEEQHRVVDFVKARIKYDYPSPPTLGLVSGTQLSPPTPNHS